MFRLSALCVSGLLVLGVCVADVSRPAALLGDVEDVQGLRYDVLVGGNVRSEFRTAEQGLDPSQYGDYAAVYLGGNLKGYGEASLWKTPESLAAARAYVERGGVVIIAGGAVNQLAAFGLVGFGSTRLCREELVGQDGTARKFIWNFDRWNLRDTFGAAELAEETETLARFEDASGNPGLPAVTRHRLGKGAVWWFSPQVSKLRIRFTWGRKNLGDADERGEVQSTAEGESLAALSALYLKAFTSAPELDTSVPASGWGLKPLGEPGTLTFGDTFANRPDFRSAPNRPAAFTFAGAGRAPGVVVAPKGDKTLAALADEVAWHLGEMCGSKIAVTDTPPTEGPAVVFFAADAKSHPKGTSLVRTEGERIYLGGTGTFGAGTASTYFLEALGCRYLWPGKSGKVIPKRSELVIPRIDLVFTTAFKHRELRMYDLKTASRSAALDTLGIDTAKMAAALQMAECDREGNRSFTRWHGCQRGNSEVAPDDFPGQFRWGHYFDGYYQKYFKDHPDWFALQPTGTREQDLGNWPERSTLCLASEGLVQETARNLIAHFRASPQIDALSICLPDGGFPAPCMCEACRRLDPVNAPATPLYLWKVFNRSFPYVSFTDRVMTFNNRVAALVAAACPGKRLTCYVYSSYVDPPVKVKPHPSLVLLSVAGDYADAEQCDWARRNVAAWSRMGNTILWRPNAPMGFKSPVPQNFARRIFEDLETFKANNVVGTDMDCISRQWTNLGLVFYMIAKAQLNPDRLSYDTLLDDYCRSGFGPASDEVKAYFGELEKLTDAAAATKKRIRGYVELFDGDRLEAILSRAEAKSADNAEILARLAFLRRGVELGRWEKRLADAEKSAPDARKRLKNEYLDFVRRTSFEDPVALCPVYIGSSFYRSPFLPR